MKKFWQPILLIFLFVFACYGLYMFFSRGIQSVSTGAIGGIVFFIGVLLFFISKKMVDTKKAIKKNKDKEPNK